MEKTNQQEQSKPMSSNTFYGHSNVLEYYIDSGVRALIAFGIVVIVMLIIGNYVKLSIGIQIGIAIILGIIISPFLTKVKVAHLFIGKYIAFLEKIADRISK